MERITSFYESGKRYNSLRIVGAIFSGVGAAMLAAGALLLVFSLYTLTAGAAGGPPATAGPFAAHQTGAVSLVTGLGRINLFNLYLLILSLGLLASGLQSVALGAVFRLLIHLEENTRASAQSLDTIRMALERREGVEPLFRS